MTEPFFKGFKPTFYFREVDSEELETELVKQDTKTGVIHCTKEVKVSALNYDFEFDGIVDYLNYKESVLLTRLDMEIDSKTWLKDIIEMSVLCKSNRFISSTEFNLVISESEYLKNKEELDKIKRLGYVDNIILIIQKEDKEEIKNNIKQLLIRSLKGLNNKIENAFTEGEETNE